jgi:hypothetical protein
MAYKFRNVKQHMWNIKFGFTDDVQRVEWGEMVQVGRTGTEGVSSPVEVHGLERRRKEDYTK